MLVLFYIIAHYILVWLLVFFAVKLDNVKERSCYETGEAYSGWNYIMYDLKNGNWWWLIFPVVNVIAAIIYLIRGIVSYTSAKIDKHSWKRTLTFVFGGKENYKK
jgi:hypothetical protein